MVVAVIALILALAGTAIAGPDAINRALTTSKVKKIAKKQANKVLNQRAGELTPDLGAITRVEGPTVSIPAGDIGSATATCPSGQGIVSGGYTFFSAEGETFYEESFDTRSWSVGGDNFDSSMSGELYAVAFCAPQALPSRQHGRRTYVIARRRWRRDRGPYTVAKAGPGVRRLKRRPTEDINRRQRWS